MMEERDERNESRSLLIFLAGGLIGAGISLIYAPLSGEKTRQYLRIQTKKAKRKARHLTESTRENIDCLISEIKETTDKVIEEGMELTKEKKAEILAAIEAGKKAMEEERSKIERHQTDRSKK
ncbi:MAG: YtxH domain-containing protein [Deltaproteobacteria bacterium]|nr:YtxH domain-containing protein [Deltaproteobacteria bacterium]